MKHVDLEKFYESLALNIDSVGKANSELYLAKLVLLLAYRNGDANEVQKCIEYAACSLSNEEIECG
ncbi:MAG: hypothetical protein AB8B87_23345 [Granulosicoccus sp.]